MVNSDSESKETRKDCTFRNSISVLCSKECWISRCTTYLQAQRCLSGQSRYGSKLHKPMFRDLGSSLATMEASKAADFIGCAPGNTIEQADVEQADVQADLKGPETLGSTSRGALARTVEDFRFEAPRCATQEGTLW